MRTWKHGRKWLISFSPGGRGQNPWVHFPIPTPAVVNGANMKVDSAMVSFRTRSNAVVNEIIVYDGEKRIAEHMDLNLRDDHLDARFEVPGSPQVNQGINITVGVTPRLIPARCRLRSLGRALNSPASHQLRTAA